MDKDDVSNVPIWIKLPQLPFKYWGERSLFKIAGMVGKVIKMDQATKEKEKLNFARVMVEIGINDTLPDSIVFCNEHGNRMEQKVEYEWRPIQCTQCKGFRHELENCRNKGGRKMWVKKGEVVKDKDGFQQIGVRHKNVRQKETNIPTHNSFHVLNEEAETSMMGRNESREMQEGRKQWGR